MQIQSLPKGLAQPFISVRKSAAFAARKSNGSETLSVDPDKLARVAGQFITPNGNQVYPVQMNGRTVYVTIPED